MPVLTRTRTSARRRASSRRAVARTPNRTSLRLATKRSPRRQELIEEWLPTAHRLAHRFAHRGEPLEDLQQVAAFGLVKAVDGYDPSYGREFRSYAIPTIVGELKRHFRDTGWDIRVSRRLQERGMNLNRAREELTATLRRAPTAAELAEHLSLTPEEVSEGLQAARAYSATSLQTPVKADGESTSELGDLLGDCDPRFELTENLVSLRPALAELKPVEQRVIAMRFYEDLTQSQIAERIGTSQMQISRMLTRTLERLRSELVATSG